MVDDKLNKLDSEKDDSDWPEDPSLEHLRQWILLDREGDELLLFDNSKLGLYYIDPYRKPKRETAKMSGFKTTQVTKRYYEWNPNKYKQREKEGENDDLEQCGEKGESGS